MTARATLQVNGIERDVEVRPTETLLETLRRGEHLYGAREGCGIGMCGACTVLVDDRPLSSCLILTSLCDGSKITTIEGLTNPEGELDPIQQAFLDCNAFQCSFCTPGFILMTKALLEENPAPSTDEIRSYLAGNLCRCASYVKIEDAVVEAGRRLAGEEARTPTSTSVHSSFDPLVPASSADLAPTDGHQTSPHR